MTYLTSQELDNVQSLIQLMNDYGTCSIIPDLTLYDNEGAIVGLIKYQTECNEYAFEYNN